MFVTQQHWLVLVTVCAAYDRLSFIDDGRCISCMSSAFGWIALVRWCMKLANTWVCVCARALCELAILSLHIKLINKKFTVIGVEVACCLPVCAFRFWSDRLFRIAFTTHTIHSTPHTHSDTHSCIRIRMHIHCGNRFAWVASPKNYASISIYGRVSCCAVLSLHFDVIIFIFRFSENRMEFLPIINSLGAIHAKK